MIVALRTIRVEPLGPLMMRSIGEGSAWLTESPVLTGLAGEMLGTGEPDPAAEQWLIRVVLALWHWPVKDPEAESLMVQRFLGPLLTG